jgi:hypothetical protein
MKKKRKQNQNQRSSKKQDELTIKDSLNSDIFKQLHDKKKELEKAEVERIEKEKLKKLEEKRIREKNKSFEELLNESNMNWEKFK